MIVGLRKKYILTAYLFIIALFLISFDKTLSQEVCPSLIDKQGAILLEVDFDPDEPPDFVAGLLGSYDLLDTGDVVGGLDWLYNSATSDTNPSIGSQLIAWWSQKNGRNTFVQVVNSSNSILFAYVSLIDENCLLLRDFCEIYTPKDAHTYDLSDLITNSGFDVPDSILQDKEGVFILTPVISCPDDLRAIAFPFLHGDLAIVNIENDIDYGTKLLAREVDALSSCTETNSEGYEVLSGKGDCRFASVIPGQFSQVFSTLPNSLASRSDLVLIGLTDSYFVVDQEGSKLSRYSQMPAQVIYSNVMFDLNRNVVSCPEFAGCFLRIGLNDGLPNSDIPLPSPSPPPPLCNGLVPTILGDSNDNVLQGTAAADIIHGQGGNDTIDGLEGNDIICGGPGDDILRGNKGADQIYGGEGNDSINGGVSNDLLLGEAGNDLLIGGAGVDRIEGGNGSDTIRGNKGNDTLNGGPGTDTLDGGLGIDTCSEGETTTNCEN